MSYLKGRGNIYSIITNSISDELKKTSDEELLYGINEQTSQNIYKRSMPSTLVNMSLVKINCGNGNKECIKCLTSYGLTFSDLIGKNYLKNIDIIEDLRNNKCFGACSCIIENVNLTNSLTYSIGYDINGSNIDENAVYNKVRDEISSGSSSTSTSSSKNWLPSLLGVPGVIFSDVTPTISTDVESSLKKIISSISITYKQTITQLISTSQVFEIQGTGVKVKNVSITNLQDAVLTAIESNCEKSKCAIKDINSVTNSLIETLTDNINKGFTSSFEYVYDQNKNLIWGTLIFIAVIMLLYFYLLFKGALKK
jgi:hypothetical protein